MIIHDKKISEQSEQEIRDNLLTELKEWATTGFNENVKKIPVKSFLFKLAELRKQGGDT